MRHHKSSIAHALQQLYPEVRFDMDKFENASCIFYYLSLCRKRLNFVQIALGTILKPAEIFLSILLLRAASIINMLAIGTL